jgi:hypothetical protein
LDLSKGAVAETTYATAADSFKEFWQSLQRTEALIETLSTKRRKQMKSKKLALFAVLALITFFAGCGGSGGGDSGGGGGTGTLALSLTDAPADGYKAVYVTIEKVQVHMGGNENQNSNWEDVSDVGNNKTYNLLDLTNGVRTELGITELRSGPYTQMRLILGRVPDDGINVLSRRHLYANYVITDADEVHELKVPSGFQTGIKIVQGFEISDNQTTELLIDFEASKSVVKAGNSGNWLLKPTIKIKNLAVYAIVRGTVTDGTEVVRGARVSAQQIDDKNTQDTSDDMPEVLTSTYADEYGEFTLFLNPNGEYSGGRYNLVASQVEVDKAYAAKCIEIMTEPGDNITIDPIVVEAAETGYLQGSVSINGADEEQHVILSFRQNLDCGANNVPAEVTSENHANTSEFTTELAVGDYQVNASTYGFTDKQYDATIEADLGTELDISFP